MDYRPVALIWDVVTTVPTVGQTWITPAFLAALATVITAVTGLVVALKTLGAVNTTATKVDNTAAQVDSTNTKVHEVAVATNGTQNAMEARLLALERALIPPGSPPVAARGAVQHATPPPAPGSPPKAP
jgi:hypothetical protein